MSPVMAILQDHLLVPSRTICSACSRLSMCVSGSTVNVVLKRRQCRRHRIVLRQPLVLFSSHRHFTLFRDSSERKTLPRRHLRGDQEVYVLRRPPKDAESSRSGKSSVIIQQQRRQHIQQLSYASRNIFAQPEY